MTYSVTDAGGNSESLKFTVSIKPDGASVYWMTEYSTGYSYSVGIHRSTLDLACWDPIVIVPDISQGYDGEYRFYSQLHVHNDKIYWVDYKPRSVHYPEPRTDRIWRADLDGTNAQVILTERISSGEITIHDGKIYWGYWNLAGTNDLHEIRRADLDGSNVETFARVNYRRVGTTIRNIVVHHGKIYWVSSVINDWVHRVNLDGSNYERVMMTGVGHMAIHSNKLYWTSNTSIWRSELDGSNREELLINLTGPPGRQPGTASVSRLSFHSDKMYWSTATWAVNHTKILSLIQRADLDGSNIETIFSIDRAISKIYDIAVVP